MPMSTRAMQMEAARIVTMIARCLMAMSTSHA